MGVATDKDTERKARVAKNEFLQAVAFKLENEEFGIDITGNQGIERIVELTKIPNSTEYEAGIINLRDKLIPVISLPQRLEKPFKFFRKDIRIEVIGFKIGSEDKVILIYRKQTEQLPNKETSLYTNYITTVSKLENNLLILHCFDKILTYHSDAFVN